MWKKCLGCGVPLGQRCPSGICMKCQAVVREMRRRADEVLNRKPPERPKKVYTLEIE